MRRAAEDFAAFLLAVVFAPIDWAIGRWRTCRGYR